MDPLSKVSLFHMLKLELELTTSERYFMVKSSSERIVIIGGGYGCLEVLEIIRRIVNSGQHCNVVGILDDNPALIGTEINGVRVLGPISTWVNFDSSHFFIHAIGNFEARLVRRDIVLRNNIPTSRFISLVDPGAVLLVPRDQIGAGSILHSGVVISAGANIGNFVVISANSVIGVGNQIGSYALFASGITTGTNVYVGSMAFLGSGAAIAPSLEIGCLSFVAVGTAVLRDVEPGHSVMGNPGRSFARIEVPGEIHSLWEDEKKSVSA